MSTSDRYTKTDNLITLVTAWIAGIIVLLLTIWGSIFLYQSYYYEETNDAQVQEYINPVTSRVGGYISKIYYDENQDVKKDDTLIVIDNSEYNIQQQEAEAALANARAQVQVLNSTIQTSAKTSQISQSQIAGANAKLLNKRQEYDRYKKLYDVESATKQQLENMQTALDVAQSEYESALENYQASLSKVNDSRLQNAVLQAEIKRREAVLNREKLDVGYSVIKAPYNGKMGRRTVQEGQSIQPGQTLAFIVDRQSGKWVIANFKETQLAGMKVGDTAEIKVDAYPDKKFKGKVASLSPATGSSFSLLPPDNSTGNFVKIVQRVPVRIRLTDASNSIEPLRAGMNTKVLIAKNQNK